MKWILLVAGMMLGGSAQPDGVRVQIVQRNEIGTRLQLLEAQYQLDGQVVARDADATGGLRGDSPVADQALLPGPHTLDVELVYRGAGLPYARRYRYVAKAHYDFVAQSGVPVLIRVRPHSRSSPTARAEQTLQVEFQSNQPPQ